MRSCVGGVRARARSNSLLVDGIAPLPRLVVTTTPQGLHEPRPLVIVVHRRDWPPRETVVSYLTRHGAFVLPTGRFHGRTARLVTHNVIGADGHARPCFN